MNQTGPELMPRIRGAVIIINTFLPFIAVFLILWR